MEIITENGKDYLVTSIAKLNNNYIVANEMFEDMTKVLDKIKSKYKRHFIKQTEYGANLQTLYSRFSGDFFSPSFMKSFMENPALALVSNTFTEKPSDATAYGNVFHEVMDEYYKQEPKDRSRIQLFDILKAHIIPGQDEDVLKNYIQGYIDMKDYLHPRTPLDDKTLICKTEHRGRAENLYAKSIGYTVPCAVSYVADRVDFRDDEVVILDYKTGTPDDSAVTFDGYLGSMILYKWVMEQELRTTITKGFLVCPGNQPSKRYMQLDFSRANEEKMAELVQTFYDKFIRASRDRVFEYTDHGYFTTDDAKAFRAIMQDDQKYLARMPLTLYIGEHNASCL